MKTVTIQIGNTDDKLSQVEWSTFIQVVNSHIHVYASRIHFNGYSDPAEPWQNACWVIEIGDSSIIRLKTDLANSRGKFRQDSIAWTEGETKFI